MKRLTPLIALLGAVAMLVGCASMSTNKEHLVEVENRLAQHDFAGAASAVQAAKDKGYTPKERVVYWLDLGMLQHYDEQFTDSNTNLGDAEYAIEELFTKSISKAALSLLLNDNALDYSGEDYEDIYLNVFKSLNYVHLGGLDEALVEVRRIDGKVRLLEDKYKELASGYDKSDDAKIKIEAGTSRFHDSALAQWLAMLLYRADRQYDDARIAQERLVEAFKSQSQLYPFPQPDVSSYLLPASDARLDVVAFVGRCPDKKAKTLYIHTEKDLIIIGTTEENPRKHQELEELDVFAWDDVQEGYHFKFQLPYLEKQGTQVNHIEVKVDGECVGRLQLIESLENVAMDTWQIKEPIIYLKTIIRATAKGLLSEKAKQNMTNELGDNLLGFAARLATDMAVDSTENADLRISRFFPAQAHVGEFTVTAGPHAITIDYFNSHGVILYTDDLGEVDITQGRLNLLETSYLK